MLKGSWKTTLVGILGFLAANGQQLMDYWQHNQNLDASKLWLGLAFMVMGLLARDNNKSSEQVGAGVTAPPPRPGKLLSIILLCTLPFLAGCSQWDKFIAGLSAALATAATHVETSVSFDPVTGTATATLHLKDEHGNTLAVKTLTLDELNTCNRALPNCKQCNDIAKAKLKASFAQAIADIKATEKRELAQLKANRQQCLAGIILTDAANPANAPPVELPAEVPPQVGDEVEFLPESGTFKVLKRAAIEQHQCQIINGKK